MSTLGNMRIERYSHFIRILQPPYYLQQLIHEFIRPLILFERIKPVGEKERFAPTKVFSGRTADRSEYRLLRTQFDDLMRFLADRGLAVSEIPITDIPLYMPARIKGKVSIKYAPKENQIAPIERIIHPVGDTRTVLVGLPTGTGKTFCGLYSGVKIGHRMLFFLLPIYVDKWIKDIQFNLGADPKRIMVVQGMTSLTGIISMGLEGTLDVDYIIVSTVTFRMFVESCDEDRNDCLEQYGCLPFDFYKILGIGNVLIDETHQHIHAIFKIMLLMHVPQLTALTATLLTESPVVKRAHDLMYPKETRYDELLMKRYIHVIAIQYQYRNYPSRNIRVSEYGTNVYSHSAYEKSIQRNLRTLHAYEDMLLYFFKEYYAKDAQAKDKALIFVATKRFGAILVDRLKKEFPRLDVRRYMEDDPYENIIEADVCVSTIISAGTAVDIPNLTTVFMTVNVNAPVANAQSIGRLREIPGRDVRFFYFYGSDIEKQVKNHYYRKTFFADRSATFKELAYPYHL